MKTDVKNITRRGMVLAAGLGTRLRPFTLSHPKALVPVGGVPMLERVLLRMKGEGIREVVVNVHHFAGQIVDFLRAHDYGMDIKISDESDELLDTGGGILKAAAMLFDAYDGGVLVHNVDILCDVSLSGFMSRHEASGNSSTLLVSERESGRRLVVAENGMLRGWHSLKENRFRPEGFVADISDREYAFSGIYVVTEKTVSDMKRLGFDGRFPVMDYFLHPLRASDVGVDIVKDMTLIDIGKPATLSQANNILIPSMESGLDIPSGNLRSGHL